MISEPDSPRAVSWRPTPSIGTLPSTFSPPKGVTLPSNFAYDEDEGYANLLLYKLSPRLAERVYPIIATQAAENAMAAILVLGMVTALPPLIDPRLEASTGCNCSDWTQPPHSFRTLT